MIIVYEFSSFNLCTVNDMNYEKGYHLVLSAIVNILKNPYEMIVILSKNLAFRKLLDS